MKNKNYAVSYFKSGYNCAQAVILTYCEKYNIDKTQALKMASSFGGGMGRLREVCGAVSMMFLVLGLEKGYIENNDDIKKEAHYALIQMAAEDFKKEHKTIICKDLLDSNDTNPTPSKRTKEYYLERPCENFIKTACDIIDNYSSGA